MAGGVLPESVDTRAPTGAASRLTGTREESSAAAPAWRDATLIGLFLQVRAVWRVCMTMDIAVITAGQMYRYHLRQTVVGDGRRLGRTPLAKAQEEAGVPVGRWMGRGLAALGLVL